MFEGPRQTGWCSWRCPQINCKAWKCFLPWLKEDFTRTTKLRVLLGESRLSYLEPTILESEGGRKENPKRSQEGSRRGQWSRAGRGEGKPTLQVKWEETDPGVSLTTSLPSCRRISIVCLRAQQGNCYLLKPKVPSADPATLWWDPMPWKTSLHLKCWNHHGSAIF